MNIRDLLQSNVDIRQKPNTRTKAFKLEGNRLTTEILDKKETLVQLIPYMLKTNTKLYEIFDSNHLALDDLREHNNKELEADLETLVTEILLEDFRMLEVSNFEFKRVLDRLEMAFTISTIYGEESVSYEF